MASSTTSPEYIYVGLEARTEARIGIVVKADRERDYAVARQGGHVAHRARHTFAAKLDHGLRPYAHLVAEGISDFAVDLEVRQVGDDGYAFALANLLADLVVDIRQRGLARGAYSRIVEGAPAVRPGSCLRC